MPSVFERIISRRLPAKIFHEDDECIVIADHRPQDTIHLLIIPKVVTDTFYNTPDELLSMLNAKTKLVAEKLGLEDHFRIVVNNGYGQEVFHLHYHFMSNRSTDKLKYIAE